MGVGVERRGAGALSPSDASNKNVASLPASDWRKSECVLRISWLSTRTKVFLPKCTAACAQTAAANTTATTNTTIRMVPIRTKRKGKENAPMKEEEKTTHVRE